MQRKLIHFKQLDAKQNTQVKITFATYQNIFPPSSKGSAAVLYLCQKEMLGTQVQVIRQKGSQCKGLESHYTNYSPLCSGETL